MLIQREVAQENISLYKAINFNCESQLHKTGYIAPNKRNRGYAKQTLN